MLEALLPAATEQPESVNTQPEAAPVQTNAEVIQPTVESVEATEEATLTEDTVPAENETEPVDDATAQAVSALAEISQEAAGVEAPATEVTTAPEEQPEDHSAIAEEKNRAVVHKLQLPRSIKKKVPILLHFISDFILPLDKVYSLLRSIHCLVMAIPMWHCLCNTWMSKHGQLLCR